MHCLGWICSFILQTHATCLFFWFVVRTFWRYCYRFLFVMYNWTSFQYWTMLDCSCLLRKKNSKEVGNKQRGYKWESREHWWTWEKNDGNKLTSRNKKQSATHVPSFISFPSSAKQQGEMTSSGASGLRNANDDGWFYVFPFAIERCHFIFSLSTFSDLGRVLNRSRQSRISPVKHKFIFDKTCDRAYLPAAKKKGRLIAGYLLYGGECFTGN